MPLHLWSNGITAVIANSRAEASNIHITAIGDPVEDESSWKALPVEKVFTVLDWDEEGAKTQTVERWILEVGPGYLGSTER